MAFSGKGIVSRIKFLNICIFDNERKFFLAQSIKLQLATTKYVFWSRLSLKSVFNL